MTKFARIAAFAVGSLVGVSSFAAGPDLTALTTAVDLTTVITAVLAIAGTLAGVYVAIKGARTVLAMIRGA